MVRRSLVLKVYLFAVGSLLATFAMLLFASNLVFERGWDEATRQMGTDYAEFLARDVELTLVGDHPSQARLLDIEKAFPVRLTFVDWSQTVSYPGGLASEKVVLSGARTPRHLRSNFWVRIDRNGHPVGALHVQPRAIRKRPPPTFALIPLLMVALFGVLFVPPLFIWIIRPLNRMVAIANRLGDGDLKTPIDVDRQDEFGRLEGAFEGMRRRIQEMLTQKERLLTDISHELRGPLSRMTIAVPLLETDQASQPYVEQIQRDIRAMDVLIGELLALSRSQENMTDKSPVDLTALIRDLIDERRIVIDQKRMTLEEALTPATILGDGRLLSRAIGNLLDNALKYTQDGGTIAVAIERDAKGIAVRVSDNGPGVADCDLPHLFEPFYRPDTSRSRETGGTGLGLAIVKTIVESHGGEARLISRNGHGLSVELRFPST